MLMAIMSMRQTFSGIVVTDAESATMINIAIPVCHHYVSTMEPAPIANRAIIIMKLFTIASPVGTGARNARIATPVIAAILVLVYLMGTALKSQIVKFIMKLSAAHVEQGIILPTRSPAIPAILPLQIVKVVRQMGPFVMTVKPDFCY